MQKYLTTKEVCERFNISRITLNRWHIKTQYGVPFPLPALPSAGGGQKRYLAKDVNRWERMCIDKSKTAA